MMEIKKCPFCGGEANLYCNYSTRHRRYFVFVQCCVCHAQSGSRCSYDHPKHDGWENDVCYEVIASWNNRQGGKNEISEDEG